MLAMASLNRRRMNTKNDSFFLTIVERAELAVVFRVRFVEASI
jgi:hypothetical protein